jgi:hypothetical protein
MSSQSKLIKDILSLYDTILENKEIEETADSLRNTIKTLGYTEKGSELTSGGDIKDRITELVSEILTQYKKTNPEVKVEITSGNDTFHQGLKYKSQHSIGHAIDVTLKPYNTENAEGFIKILKDIKSKNNDFSYRDEYTNPSKSSTGGHFHLVAINNSSFELPSGDEPDGKTGDEPDGITKEKKPDILRNLIQGVADTVLPVIGIKEEKIVKDNWFKKKKLNENIDRIKGLL